MKKLTLLLFTIVFLSCSEKERNCQDFKTGKFEFTQDIDGKKHVSTFTRTSTLQIETYNGKTDSGFSALGKRLRIHTAKIASQKYERRKSNQHENFVY